MQFHMFLHVITWISSRFFKFPPSIQKHAAMWIGYAEFPLDLNEYVLYTVCVCTVYGDLRWMDFLALCYQDRLGIHSDPDQHKIVTEDK